MIDVGVESVSLRAATAVDQSAGLVGFVNATINGLVIEGIAVRRSLGGQLVLSFPKRRDKYGRIHTVVRPVDNGVRRAVTIAILAAVGLGRTASTPPESQGESAGVAS